MVALSSSEALSAMNLGGAARHLQVKFLAGPARQKRTSVDCLHRRVGGRLANESSHPQEPLAL